MENFGLIWRRFNMIDRLNDFSQRYIESWAFGRFAPFSRSKCLFCTNTVKLFKHKRREKCFILSKHTYPCTKFSNGIPRKYFLDKIHYNDPNVHRFCKDYDRYRYVVVKEYTYMLNQYKGIDNIPPWVREDKLTILLHQYKLCNTITEIIKQKQLSQ